MEVIMKYFIKNINKILAELCGWLLIAMVIFIMIDIISRLIKKPIHGVAEIAVFVMIIAVYLGLSNCEENDEHIKVELVVPRIKGKYSQFIKLIQFLIEISITFIVLISVWKNFIMSYKTQESVTGTTPLPIWPVKFIMVIGLLFFFFQIGINFFNDSNNKV